MAVLCSRADGNLTTAATWGTVFAGGAGQPFLDNIAGANLCDATWRGDVTGAFTPGAITIDAILFQVAYRASPGSGTFSVRLYNNTDLAAVAGTQVDINATDVPSAVISLAGNTSVGWMIFKLAAPVLLVAAKAYIVQASCSVASAVSGITTGVGSYRWGHGVRVDGAAGAAPTTGDQVIIAGDWTAPATMAARVITMDQTNSAIKYGTTSATLFSVSITSGGTLTFDVGAFNYFMNVQGILFVAPGGTLNIGTVAIPIPAGTTATLNFDLTGGAGQYWLRNFGTVIIQGVPRTAGKLIVGCLLTANKAVGTTVWDVDRDTGWKAGDVIVIAGTQRATNKADVLTLAIDATATQLTTGAGTFQHDGVLPVQAEVINKTRNVIVRTTTVNKQGYIQTGNGSTFDADWAAFVGMGGTSGGSRGITRNACASFHIDYCYFDPWGLTNGFAVSVDSSAGQLDDVTAISLSNLSGIDFWDQMIYQRGATVPVTKALSLTDIWIVGQGAWGASGLLYHVENCDVTLTRVRVSGGYTEAGAIRWENTTAPTSPKRFTILDSIFHDCSFPLAVSGTIAPNLYISNTKFLRLKANATGAAGVYATGGIEHWLLDTCEFQGSVNSGFEIGNTRSVHDLILRNCKFGGTAAYAQQHGFRMKNGGNGERLDLRFENCLFGSDAGGDYVDHAQADVGMVTPAPITFMNATVAFVNTLLGSGTEIDAGFLAALAGRSWIAYQRADGVLGAHSVNYPRLGTVARDAVFFRSSAPSEKMTPTGAADAMRLQSAPKRFDVNTGSQKTPGVYVWLDPAYTGLAPRLMLKANPAIGIDNDEVLATHTGATGVWQKLSGTMSVASEDDGQGELFVDCTGAAGFVSIDDWEI